MQSGHGLPFGILRGGQSLRGVFSGAALGIGCVALALGCRSRRAISTRISITHTDDGVSSSDDRRHH
ncbi:MAG: hypothetical protein Fur0019_19240 [Tibeticola sp.]